MTLTNNADIPLEAAMDLFWRQGFLGTSMRQLQKAMDMRPGSLYSRFGGKDALYKACLRHYRDSRTVQLNTCLSRHSSPLSALRAFVDLQLCNDEADVPHQCLLQRTVEDLTDDHQALRSMAIEYLRDSECSFAALLSNKSVTDELTDQELSLGRWFQIQFMGLRAYKGLGADDGTIEQLIDDVFAGMSSRVTPS